MLAGRSSASSRRCRELRGRKCRNFGGGLGQSREDANAIERGHFNLIAFSRDEERNIKAEMSCVLCRTADRRSKLMNVGGGRFFTPSFNRTCQTCSLLHISKVLSTHDRRYLSQLSTFQAFMGVVIYIKSQAYHCKGIPSHSLQSLLSLTARKQSCSGVVDPEVLHVKLKTPKRVIQFYGITSMYYHSTSAYSHKRRIN